MSTAFYRRLSRLLEIALIVLMVVAVAVMISLPWTITYITGAVPGVAEGHEAWLYEKYLALLLISGGFAELILWQVRGIAHNVNAQRPFCDDTARRMRVCGVECFILSMLYLVSMLVIAKFFMAIVAVVFLVVACVLLVLADLFRQATGFKEENDMTI